MKVLVLGTDKNAFLKTSETFLRLKKYSELISELHIIIKTKKEDSLEFFKDGNLYLYPTKSYFKLGFLFGFYLLGKSILKNSKIDLISSQDPFECGLIANILAKKFKLPLHIQIHTDFLNPLFVKLSFINSLRVVLGKLIVKRASEIRVVSNRIKYSLIKIGISENFITVLPILTDWRRERDQKSSFDLRHKYKNYDYIILMASRLEREKDFGLAINIVDEILKSGGVSGSTKILLLVVGSGSEREFILKRSAEVGISSNIAIEEWAQDLAPYYIGADILLLTSFYEGFGRTMIEAMSLGCPVVSVDCGVAGEIGAEIIPRDSQIASKIIISKLKEHKRVNNFDSFYKISEPDYLKKYYNSWVSALKVFK
ncbi:MAG: glycosyltransferase [Candidatus Pacebacteria bacterium]|nr:glycosyltransferase [Candidatus Paceibacterota bacterium]